MSGIGGYEFEEPSGLMRSNTSKSCASVAVWKLLEISKHSSDNFH